MSEITPVTHTEKVVAGQVDAVTHFEKVIAKYGGGGGGGGTSDYTQLSNKPKINNVELNGNKSLADIGAQPTIDGSHKLSADNVDDTSTTNKFATAAQLSQIETNKNNISSFHKIDGTDIYFSENVPIGTITTNSYWISKNGIRIYGVTDNLIDISTIQNGYNIGADGYPIVITTNPDRCATTTPIDLTNIDSVTISYTGDADFIYSLFNGTTLSARVAANASGTTITTTDVDKMYLCWYKTGEVVTSNDISDIDVIGVGWH